MSPFAIPPLPQLGRWMTQKVHGNVRSAEGFLLTKNSYIDPDTEWRIGQAYLGVAGFPVYVVIWFYVYFAHHDTGYWVGHRHYIGHWANWPLDLKILTPIAILGFFVGMGSIVRLFILWSQFGSRDELDK